MLFHRYWYFYDSRAAAIKSRVELIISMFRGVYEINIISLFALTFHMKMTPSRGWLFRFATARGRRVEINSLRAFDIISRYARVLKKKAKIKNKINTATIRYFCK